MITRLIASAGAVSIAVIALVVTTASPAAACLIRCDDEEIEGTILGGLMSNIFLGLLIGLVIAVIASFLAFREGKRRGLMSSDGEHRESDERDR